MGPSLFGLGWISFISHKVGILHPELRVGGDWLKPGGFLSGEVLVSNRPAGDKGGDTPRVWIRTVLN